MRQGHGSKSFKSESYDKIINMLIYEMLRIQCNYETDGYFSEYGIPGTESIWLTSWAITVIKDGMDPQWERDGLFIDPKLINQTVLWLASKQSQNGSWTEIGPTYDRKFKSNFTKNTDGSLVELNLALTAKALIALVANSDVRGETATIASISINRARFYLEQHFSKITDIFERCIVTYALHVSNSPIRDIAFKLLNQTRIKDENGIYWSNWIIPRAKVYWPSKNPRQFWKPESNHEAYAVTATSYALLTYLFRAEETSRFEIVKWLITQKNYFAGMTSTYDSLIAHKALVLYSISNGDSFQNYNINIKIKSSSSDEDFSSQIFIDDNNMIDPQYYDLNNAWGSLELEAKG
jgi:CD109 antigen